MTQYWSKKFVHTTMSIGLWVIFCKYSFSIEFHMLVQSHDIQNNWVNIIWQFYAHTIHREKQQNLKLHKLPIMQIATLFVILMVGQHFPCNHWFLTCLSILAVTSLVVQSQSFLTSWKELRLLKRNINRVFFHTDSLWAVGKAKTSERTWCLV